MKLYLLYAQRKQRYEGEYQPELLEAIDETTIDENSDLPEELLKKHRANTDLLTVEWFAMTLPAGSMKAIHDRLNKPADLGLGTHLAPMEPAS